MKKRPGRRRVLEFTPWDLAIAGSPGDGGDQRRGRVTQHPKPFFSGRIQTPATAGRHLVTRMWRGKGMVVQRGTDPGTRSAVSKLAAGFTLFVGLFSAILGSSHVYGVMVTANLKAYRYNFRLASLYLVGLTIVAAGVLCIAAGRGLARGQRIGWERALFGTTLLLLISVPLIPMQTGLAGGLSTVGVLNLVALAAAWLLLRTGWNTLER
jgi:hypothetical protein